MLIVWIFFNCFFVIFNCLVFHASQGPNPVGGRRVGAQTQKKWGPEGWGPEGCGAQNFALFSLPPQNSFFSSLSGGLHTTTREPKRAYLSAPVFKNTPKFHEKTPQREKKRAKFWAVQGKGVRGRGPKILNTPTTHTTHTHKQHQQAPTANRHQQAPTSISNNQEQQQHRKFGQNTKNTNSGQMRFGQMQA